MATAVQSQPETRPAATSPPAVAPDRLVSLDAYRGFVMLAMVSSGLGMAKLMDDPTWGGLADQLEHRKWEGCTFWDLIQPSFMFIVGVAMPFSYARREKQGDSWGRQFRHAIRRALLLIAIGVFLDSFNANGPIVQMIRVLQQIALGYVIAFLVLHRGPLVQAATAAGLLAVHTLIFLGYGWLRGVDPWAYEIVNRVYVCDNPGAFLDGWLHTHLQTGTNWLFQTLFHADTALDLWPPSKGGYVVLNAVSSAATILFGVLCGELLGGDVSRLGKLAVLLLAGAAGLAAGVLLSGGEWQVGSVHVSLPSYVPLVKRIWTSSFGVFAAGWTCLLMLVFYGVIDVLRFRRWALPFVVAGMNSIALYVMAGVLKEPALKALRPVAHGPLSFVPRAEPVVLAVAVTLVLWLCCYWLYRQRIFFKV